MKLVDLFEFVGPETYNQSPAAAIEESERKGNKQFNKSTLHFINKKEIEFHFYLISRIV